MRYAISVAVGSLVLFFAIPAWTGEDAENSLAPTADKDLQLPAYFVSQTDFKSVKAKAAQKKFGDALEAARKAYMVDLGVAMKDATKAANLDESLKIRSEIEAYAEPRASVNADKPSTAKIKASTAAKKEDAIVDVLIGKWAVQANDYRGIWTFNRDGTAQSTSGNHLGIWRKEADGILVAWQYDIFKYPLDTRATVVDSWTMGKSAGSAQKIK